MAIFLHIFYCRRCAEEFSKTFRGVFEQQVVAVVEIHPVDFMSSCKQRTAKSDKKHPTFLTEVKNEQCLKLAFVCLLFSYDRVTVCHL